MWTMWTTSATVISVWSTLCVMTSGLWEEEHGLEKFFPEIKGDLTKITWIHAVNSKQRLKDALKGKAMMLEADVIIGNLKGIPGLLPVMGHPPNTTSDLSLEQFLNEVVNSGNHQGIKLDFKSKEAFAGSEHIVEELLLKTEGLLPMMLNADILPGPVNSTVKPVDADYFLGTAVNKFASTILSVGWTTNYGNGIDYGSYTEDQLSNMTEALNRNNVIQPVTFPVRAGLAAQSVTLLSNLVLSSAHTTTLTIWMSNDHDTVDIPQLRKLIRNLGKNKVLLDVPENVKEELEKAGSSATVATVALVSACLLLAISYQHLL